VPLFRWQHRLHRWTSHALLIRRHGPARRDCDAPTHRATRLGDGRAKSSNVRRWTASGQTTARRSDVGRC